VRGPHPRRFVPLQRLAGSRRADAHRLPSGRRRGAQQPGRGVLRPRSGEPAPPPRRVRPRTPQPRRRCARDLARLRPARALPRARPQRPFGAWGCSAPRRHAGRGCAGRERATFCRRYEPSAGQASAKRRFGFSKTGRAAERRGGSSRRREAPTGRQGPCDRARGARAPPAHRRNVSATRRKPACERRAGSRCAEGAPSWTPAQAPAPSQAVERTTGLTASGGESAARRPRLFGKVWSPA
jgi:hypothetical protein